MIAQNFLHAIDYESDNENAQNYAKYANYDENMLRLSVLVFVLVLNLEWQKKIVQDENFNY
jgi:hypothetical protein